MSDPTSATVAPPADLNEKRLDDLELFVRGVVHDLNNALNVMKTNLYLLRQRLPEDEIKITRPLDRINDQVDAIRVLLEGHQSLYHTAQPARQRLDLNELVARVVEDSRIPEGYQLSVRPDETLPPVEGDPKLLAAALRALLRNSMRAMPGTGEIRVVTRNAGDCAEITVEDSGPGIPPEIISQAFEPFVTTWQDHAGLGLTLVERVARAHGGSAALHSNLGEGVQVTVSLPV
ncbi:MAG: sensor histidine kinase [Actinomycetota bacterium]